MTLPMIFQSFFQRFTLNTCYYVFNWTTENFLASPSISVQMFKLHILLK